MVFCTWSLAIIAALLDKRRRSPNVFAIRTFVSVLLIAIPPLAETRSERGGSGRFYVGGNGWGEGGRGFR